MSRGLEGCGADDVPVVSVISSCRNGASTLPVQLDALAAQECSFPWELVLVDTGSTDRTVALVWSYADRIPGLRVIQTPVPESQAAGLNLAAASARAPYLVVVDADDEVGPGYLAAMKTALDEHPVVGARVDDERLNPPWTRVRVHPMQRDELTRLHGFVPMIVGAALGIRAEIFTAVGGFDPTSTPLIDVDLSWRLQLAGYELALAPGAVLHYRYRTDWRATFTQKRRYAAGDVLLARRYRAAGVPRRGWKVTLRWWWEVVDAALHVRDRRGWFLFVEQLGGAVGRLEGSVRYHYAHL